MISIDDERLDGIIAGLERWFIPFIVLFFLADAALTFRFAKTIPGWLFQVIFTVALLFPVSYAFGYLAYHLGWKMGASTHALRTAGVVVVGIFGLCFLWYLIGFIFRPSAYETGLIGLVVPLGLSGATMRFWDHTLR